MRIRQAGGVGGLSQTRDQNIMEKALLRIAEEEGLTITSEELAWFIMQNWSQDMQKLRNALDDTTYYNRNNGRFWKGVCEAHERMTQAVERFGRLKCAYEFLEKKNENDV